MKIVSKVLNLGLTIVLLYFVYHETGWATTSCLGLIAVALELVGWGQQLQGKCLKEMCGFPAPRSKEVLKKKVGRPGDNGCANCHRLQGRLEKIGAEIDTALRRKEQISWGIIRAIAEVE